MIALRTPVDVAAGVLIRPDGRFLLASRPSGKPYASYWEFPGGKVEPGESVPSALARELREELGVVLGIAHPWVVRVFDYPHALVRLHFFRVFNWSGEVEAHEHQSFGFFSVNDLPDGPLLPATIPVLRWLALPALYAISSVARLGRDMFLQRLESALARGLKLLQYREPALDSATAAATFDDVLALVRTAGATLLVSSRHPRMLWDRADGVHLTATDLAKLQKRPELQWVGASVHAAAEIERAAALELDFVAVGPVLTTATHATVAPLGWDAFARMAAGKSLPVYALGGLQPTDIARAMACGAHGVASLSAVWNDQCGRLDVSGTLSASFSPTMSPFPATE